MKRMARCERIAVSVVLTESVLAERAVSALQRKNLFEVTSDNEIVLSERITCFDVANDDGIIFYEYDLT